MTRRTRNAPSFQIVDTSSQPHANLTVGTRVYYTGDCANLSDFGTISEVQEDRWGKSYKITWETEGHNDSIVSVSSFSAGPGCRFWTVADWNASQNAKADAFMARLAEMKAKQ